MCFVVSIYYIFTFPAVSPFNSIPTNPIPGLYFLLEGYSYSIFNSLSLKGASSRGFLLKITMSAILPRSRLSLSYSSNAP
jgi:hypothetical protein